MDITFYFDRYLDSINGFLTLQTVDENGQVQKLFDKLKARSGQRGHTKTDWVRGKSPIPFGTHWLSTRKMSLMMEPKGTPFYPIGSVPGCRIIGSTIPGQHRYDIGLHLENKFPGSAGCVVLLVDTPEQHAEAKRLFEYLDKLSREGVQFIKFVVL